MRHTFPSFELSHLGYSIQRGRFNTTAGKITLDTAAKKGTADITIDAASVDTGFDKLEEHLRGEDFFNVAKHPTITFKGDKFTFEGDKVKSVAGNLTILGVTRPVTLTASYFNCARASHGEEEGLRRRLHHDDQAHRLRHEVRRARGRRRRDAAHPGRGDQGLTSIAEAGVRGR